MDRQDLAINTEGDLLVVSGDLAIDDSDFTHIEHIMASYPGDWKENPELGYGIPTELNGALTRESRRRLKIQLESDGYDINDVEILAEGTAYGSGSSAATPQGAVLNEDDNIIQNEDDTPIETE